MFLYIRIIVIAGVGSAGKTPGDRLASGHQLPERTSDQININTRKHLLLLSKNLHFSINLSWVSSPGSG